MDGKLESLRDSQNNSPLYDSGGKEGAKRGLVWRLLPLAILAVGFALFFLLDFDRYLRFEALAEHRVWLTTQVAEHYVVTVLLYSTIYALAVAFSVPGAAVLTILGGFLFGTWAATVYVVVSATIGAVAVFLAARSALGDVLRKRAGAAVQRMRAGFQEDALSYLLVLRLIPIFPFWLVNLVPALIGVPLRTYVVGTLLGIIPGTLVYASLGNGVGALLAVGETPNLDIIFRPEILLPIVGLAVLAMLPVAYKRYRAHKARGR